MTPCHQQGHKTPRPAFPADGLGRIMSPWQHDLGSRGTGV